MQCNQRVIHPILKLQSAIATVVTINCPSDCGFMYYIKLTLVKIWSRKWRGSLVARQLNNVIMPLSNLERERERRDRERDVEYTSLLLGLAQPSKSYFIQTIEFIHNKCMCNIHELKWTPREVHVHCDSPATLNTPIHYIYMLREKVSIPQRSSSICPACHQQWHRNALESKYVGRAQCRSKHN